MTENNKFENCICVPLNIYVFTRKFFFLKEEPKRCSCPVFGSDSGKQETGYTVYDALDLNGKSKSIANLAIEMGATPVYSNIVEVFAILLCTYLGEIINRYNIGLEYPICSSFSTTIDEIDKAYSGISQNADELLCEIYFYICVCIRGIDTFNPYRLCSFFKGIYKYSKSSAKNICENLDEVVKGVKNGESYIDILKNQPQNYLACVCAFLEFLYDKCNNCNKTDMICKFCPTLEHFKTAFLRCETSNPFEISNLIKRLKQILE